MTAEPYICIKGERAGEIDWTSTFSGMSVVDLTIESKIKSDLPDGKWQPYADFEREKLRELGRKRKVSHIYAPGDASQGGWHWTNGYGDSHYSRDLIGYSYEDYLKDTESGRLLNRAKFLKAVVEAEGLEWLPITGWCDCGNPSDVTYLYHSNMGCEKPSPKRKETDIVKEMCGEGECLVEVGDKKVCIGNDEAVPQSACAECGSTNTRFDFMFGHAVNHSGLECRNCGHYKRYPPTPQTVDSAEQEFYTKQEIDERISGLVDLIHLKKCKGIVESMKDFRSRFLS